VTLFAGEVIKPKRKKKLRDHQDARRIPTGAPRLVESSTERLGRANANAWKEMIDAIRRSCEARVELLKGRSGGDVMPCPWERFGSCDQGCRCAGTRTITVGRLRKHYAKLTIEILLFVTPSMRKP
jgi:hypothetical protein